MTPVEFHPDLTADRLEFLTALIVEVRNATVDRQQPRKGETSWSLGCRFLERIIHAIKGAAKTRPWIRVLDGSRHFRFFIGSVPLAIYRGRAREPRGGALKRRFPELRAIQGAFAFFEKERDLCVRLALETDSQGRPSGLHLVRLDGKLVRDTWQIWSAMPVIAMGNDSTEPGVHKLQGAPTSLPRPKLRAKKVSAGESLDPSGTNGDGSST